MKTINQLGGSTMAMKSKAVEKEWATLALAKAIVEGKVNVARAALYSQLAFSSAEFSAPDPTGQ